MLRQILILSLVLTYSYGKHTKRINRHELKDSKSTPLKDNLRVHHEKKSALPKKHKEGYELEDSKSLSLKDNLRVHHEKKSALPKKHKEGRPLAEHEYKKVQYVSDTNNPPFPLNPFRPHEQVEPTLPPGYLDKDEQYVPATPDRWYNVIKNKGHVSDISDAEPQTYNDVIKKAQDAGPQTYNDVIKKAQDAEPVKDVKEELQFISDFKVKKDMGPRDAIGIKKKDMSAEEELLKDFDVEMEKQVQPSSPELKDQKDELLYSSLPKEIVRVGKPLFQNDNEQVAPAPIVAKDELSHASLPKEIVGVGKPLIQNDNVAPAPVVAKDELSHASLPKEIVGVGKLLIHNDNEQVAPAPVVAKDELSHASLPKEIVGVSKPLVQDDNGNKVNGDKHSFDAKMSGPDVFPPSDAKISGPDKLPSSDTQMRDQKDELSYSSLPKEIFGVGKPLFQNDNEDKDNVLEKTLSRMENTLRMLKDSVTSFDLKVKGKRSSTHSNKKKEIKKNLSKLEKDFHSLKDFIKFFQTK